MANKYRLESVTSKNKLRGFVEFNNYLILDNRKSYLDNLHKRDTGRPNKYILFAKSNVNKRIVEINESERKELLRIENLFKTDPYALSIKELKMINKTLNE